jgi:cation transport regulator ChaC
MGLLRVFGYGSLVEEPSLPERVVSVALARAPGLQRRFHVRSTYRGCARDQARWPDIEVLDFVSGELRESLVLGTAEAPGAWLTGGLITWEDPDGAVLAALDRREGVDPRAPEAGPYRRRPLTVRVGHEDRSALYYPSNRAHPRFVQRDLDEQARILLHATPRHVDRDRGALYLLPLWAWLHRHGVPDPYLDALVDRMRRLVGDLPAPVRQPGPYSMLDGDGG